jgi:hypothetical protein
MGDQHRMKALVLPFALAAAIAALWLFPKFWYTKRASEQVHWFFENEAVAGWTFQDQPVGKAAEAVLVGDRMVNGEFVSPEGRMVRVFSAKRYEEKANEIGLFMHTPDRCWTQIGWRVEENAPEMIEVEVHGVRLPVERRIFVHQNHRELVYFTGLVGGEPLPYRLDHHLSVAKKYQVKNLRGDAAGAGLRAADSQFWSRLWDSFENRRELWGPKHFLRISTPLGRDVAAADKRLQEFLPMWLAPVDYSKERAEWKLAANSKAESSK